MFVLTVDQKRSRRSDDLVDGLLADFADHDFLRRFERTAGDEVQAVLDSPAAVVDIAVDLVERKTWSVGVGIGTVRTPLPASTRAGHGPAFEAARRAVERAKRAPARLAVEGSPDAETVLTMLAFILDGRTDPGREAVALLRRGLTQSVAADTLGITKQAVSQRLAAAGWHAEGRARELAARLLDEADR